MNDTVNYQEIIHETASKHWNVADEYKVNTLDENVEVCRKDSLPISVGLINITGELNVGMMIRSACLFGAETIYTFGRKKYDKRSTVGAQNYSTLVQYKYDDPMTAGGSILTDLIDLSKKHTIILCEGGGDELGSFNWSYRYIPSPLFIFGSESFGIPEEITNHFYNNIVSIPQRGVLRSFNVSAAMNIIVWDYMKDMNYV